MFDSGISVKNLIEELENEVDIALQIPNKTYITWLNSLQQLLYGDIIKEQRETTVTDMEAILFYQNGILECNSLNHTNNEAEPRFEDIHTIYADGVQLMKTTLTSGKIFPNAFYKTNDNIGFNIEQTTKKLRIIHYVKPALVTVTEDDEINDVNVMLPVEFIDLVKSKLRGEAYKLANEDDMAAKWLNDYNTLLETFKVWITDKSPNLGI